VEESVSVYESDIICGETEEMDAGEVANMPDEDRCSGCLEYHLEK
jgi:hypothetical protein